MRAVALVCFLIAGLLVVGGGIGVRAQSAAAKAKPTVRYGSNPAAGKYFTHDGVKLYYETYGQGEPLLLIHGNGGSIADLKAQIEHFRKRYRVIVMDSRDHGKSGDSAEAITYEKMTGDQAALLDHLQTGPVNVLGWSDGGIEALLLAMHHPAKVKKIAVMAANLNPSAEALHPDAVKLIQEMVQQMSGATQTTPPNKRQWKVTQMMLEHPNIKLESLRSITAPALILAGDHDVIRDEHTIDIYHQIPNSQLCIFPNATHMILYDDPVLFNATVERFLRTPFVKRDRIGDFLKSYEAMKGGK